MYRLENWCVRSDANPYQPPEMQSIYLSGEVYDHTRWEDGERISTSNIKKADGNVITTQTGSVYTLGEPDPEYIKYCEDNGGHVPTKEVPIKEISNG